MTLDRYGFIRHLLDCSVAAVLACGAASCSKEKKSEVVVIDDAGPHPVTVPGYLQVRLGMPSGELMELFPAQESVESCAPRLIGTEPARPRDQQTPFSRCANSHDLGGMTTQELSIMAHAIIEHETGNRVTVLGGALNFVLGQVRGSVHAGAVHEKEVEAAGSGKRGAEAVFMAATKLLDGARASARIRNSRRSICAVLQEDCNGVDADKLRDYALTSWSYGKIDGLARRRCGPCRGKYVANEKDYQLLYVLNAGAFAGLGLAQAGKTEPLNPGETKQYAQYTSRSKLDASTARLGVLLANAVPRSESYWKGAILLDRGKTADKQWGNAIVWLQDGIVSRVLLNISEASHLEGLPVVLSRHFGSQPVQQGSVYIWTLTEGRSAKLDVGVALSLELSDG